MTTKELIKSRPICISCWRVKAFANATGDRNPIHFSDKAAQEAGFKRTVVHGALTLIAPFIVKEFGDGVMLRSMDKVVFWAPVLVGEPIYFVLDVGSDKIFTRNGGKLRIIEAELDCFVSKKHTETLPGKIVFKGARLKLLQKLL